MPSDSSENEFEDAVDTLGPLPSTPSMQARQLDLCTPLNSGGHYSLNSPFLKLDLSAQSSRRNRLATLRNRMQTEFSGASGNNVNEDDATQSEKTSLASWGRNFLMERNNDSAVIAVCPADSLSTKATNFSFNSNSFFNQSNMSGIHSETTSRVLNDSGMNQTARTLTNMAMEDKTISPIPTMAQQHPPVISPPKCYSPSSPPPPLPERPGVASTSTINKSPLAPPPLPPRKTPAQPAKSLAIEQLSPDNTFETSKQSNLFVDNNGVGVSSTKSSGSSTPSNVADGYGKKRGHAKTNSLDRGLTLAKSLKCGPFPPPSSAVNKSRSLNRGVSPSEMLAVGAICEEDQAAHNVIEQITDSILSCCETDDEDSSDNEEMKENGVKREAATTAPPTRPPFPSKAVESNLMAVGEESSTTSTPTKLQIQQTTAATPSKSQTLPRYENLYPSVEPFEKSTEEKSQDSIQHNAHSNNSLNITSANQSTNPSHSESFDPITRDVQRRMSMKNHSPADIHAEQFDGEDQPNEAANGGLEHAKNVVKSYGSMASGFFKGAFTRAKKTIAPNSNPPKALTTAKEDDDEAGSESDDGTPSVSENVPPSHPQSKKPSEPEIICRPKNHKKGPYDFDQLRVVQELNNEHSGAVWCVKFSVCGRLIATAGQDNIVRIWVLKSYLNHFTKVREKLNIQTSRAATSSNANPELSYAMQDLENAVRNAEDKKSVADTDSLNSSQKSPEDESPAVSASAVMAPKPFVSYRGHTADVLDLSWSRNYFLLSCGMDRTVRLWHLARTECLCCFQHMDFVTCISFMPKDDRYFISGSLDGKIRLWHIPEKKVALWNEVEQVKFITAITFVRNGKFVVVGTYNGRCFFYTTDQLKYHTVIDVRSTRGKNARGHKITSLAVHGDKLLVTSNDSRIRIYDLRDMDLTCKFKGAQIEQSQIRASFSPDGKHVISGSEDNYIYIWRAADFSPSLSVRKDRNPMWERVKNSHNSIVTAAVFAPKPHLFLALLEDQQKSQSISASGSCSETIPISTKRQVQRMDSEHSINVVSTHGALSTVHIPLVSDIATSGSTTPAIIPPSSSIPPKDRQLQGDIIVSADLNGNIKIYANPSRIKTGSSNFFPTEYS